MGAKKSRVPAKRRSTTTPGEVRELIGLGMHSTQESDHLSSSEHTPNPRLRYSDIELRVVQSEFMHITLSEEKRGLRVSGACLPGKSGIQDNDLITKVGGIPVHSKARRRPPLSDGMAICVRRQLS